MNSLYKFLEKSFCQRGDRFMVVTMCCTKTGTATNLAIMSVEDGVYIGFPIEREVRTMTQLKLSPNANPDPVQADYLFAQDGYIDIAAPLVIDSAYVSQAEFMYIDGCCIQEKLRKRLAENKISTH